jgi:hypothetical protein
MSRFVLLHGVAAVPKTPIPRASEGPENTQLRTAQIVNSGRAEILRCNSVGQSLGGGNWENQTCRQFFSQFVNRVWSGFGETKAIPLIERRTSCGVISSTRQRPCR